MKKRSHGKPARQLVVEARWDDDAEVWVAQSDDVPGLVTEAGSRALLIDKLGVLVPELLELNDHPDASKPIDLMVRFRRKAAKREQRIRLRKAA